MLQYPANNTTVGDPFYYQWTPVHARHRYVVQLSSGAGSPTPAPFPQQCTTVHTTLVYGDDPGDCWPTAPGTYGWRVTARDEFSNEMPVTDGIPPRSGRSPTSRNWSLRPGRPAAVCTPAGTTRTGPWGHPSSRGTRSQADEYKVDDAGTTTQSFTTAALATRPGTWPRALTRGMFRRSTGSARSAPDTRPVSGPSRSGSRPWSRTSRTTVIAQSRPPLGGQPPNPNAPAGSHRFPTLTWSPVIGVDHYRLYVGPAGNSGTPSHGKLQPGRRRDTGTTHLSPGTTSGSSRRPKDGTYLTGDIGTFSIVSPRPPAANGRALTGNAMTGNVGTTLDTCDLNLPITCQNLRHEPVLMWDADPTSPPTSCTSPMTADTNPVPGYNGITVVREHVDGHSRAPGQPGG